MNYRSLAILTATGLVSAFAAQAIDGQEFVNKAAVAGEFEIESSKLALEKSQNKDIQRFAQLMIDDHTKANTQLNSTLKDAKVEPPKTELDAKHQAIMNTLQAASKDDFNHKYISAQTDAHKEAVSLFDDYSKHGENAPLKDFAAQTLPTLEGHLKHVKELKDEQ